MVIQWTKDRRKLYFLYTLFGTITSTVDMAVYIACIKFAEMSVITSNVIAYFFSTSVSYLTNRKWVFHSENDDLKSIIREALSFFGCRWLTLVMGTAIITLGIHAFNMDEIVMKFISAVFVVVVNYFANKIVIFRKR